MLRQRAARAVRWLAYATGAAVWNAKRTCRMRVLKFHGVGTGEYPPDLLEAQLRFLAEHFRLVPLLQIVETARSGHPIRGDEVALTFDDGLRNNARVAAPLLARYGAPATFFVCPGLIERGAWLWNHEARERLSSLAAERRRATLAAIGAPPSAIGEGDVEPAIEWMKTLPRAAREVAEGEIRAATPAFEPSAEQRQRFDIMTWSDLRQVDPTWITIGSHTVSHPILPTLGREELDYEVAESRRWLEATLGRQIELFCYPNGAENERVRSAVAARYRAAVTTVPGSIRHGQDPFSLPRIGIRLDLPQLAWELQTT